MFNVCNGFIIKNRPLMKSMTPTTSINKCVGGGGGEGRDKMY